MKLLASCSLEEALNYKGKLVVPGEDQNSRPDKVELNIVIKQGDDDEEVNNLSTDTVSTITYEYGAIPSAWGNFQGKVFYEVPLERFEHSDMDPVFDGVTTLVRVPDEFCDMRKVADICEKNENIRVIGGNLLQFDGVRIGRFDTGKDKMSPVYNEVYDNFLEVKLSDLNNLKEIIRKARKRLDIEDSKDVKGVKEKKPKKNSIKKQALTNLFGSTEEEF